MSGFNAEPAQMLFDSNTAAGLGRFKGVVDQYGTEDYVATLVTDNTPAANIVGMRMLNTQLVVPFAGAGALVNDISTANGGTATNSPTINLASGRFTALAAANSVAISNSQVSVSTKAFASLATADATGWIKNVVCSAGLITITFGAALTANANVDFHITA